MPTDQEPIVEYSLMERFCLLGARQKSDPLHLKSDFEWLMWTMTYEDWERRPLGERYPDRRGQVA